MTENKELDELKQEALDYWKDRVLEEWENEMVGDKAFLVEETLSFYERKRGVWLTQNMHQAPTFRLLECHYCERLTVHHDSDVAEAVVGHGIECAYCDNSDEDEFNYIEAIGRDELRRRLLGSETQ